MQNLRIDFISYYGVIIVEKYSGAEEKAVQIIDLFSWYCPSLPFHPRNKDIGQIQKYFQKNPFMEVDVAKDVANSVVEKG